MSCSKETILHHLKDEYDNYFYFLQHNAVIVYNDFDTINLKGNIKYYVEDKNIITSLIFSTFELNKIYSLLDSYIHSLSSLSEKHIIGTSLASDNYFIITTFNNETKEKLVYFYYISE